MTCIASRRAGQVVAGAGSAAISRIERERTIASGNVGAPSCNRRDNGDGSSCMRSPKNDEEMGGLAVARPERDGEPDLE